MFFLTTGTSPRRSLTASHSQAPWQAACSPLIAVHSYCHWTPVPPTPLASQSLPRNLRQQPAPGLRAIPSIRTGEWAPRLPPVPGESLGLDTVPGTLHGPFNKKKKGDAGFQMRGCEGSTSWGKSSSRIGLLRVGTNQGHVTCLRINHLLAGLRWRWLSLRCIISSITAPAIPGRVLVCWDRAIFHSPNCVCSRSPFLHQPLPGHQIRSQ